MKRNYRKIYKTESVNKPVHQSLGKRLVRKKQQPQSQEQLKAENERELEELERELAALK